MAAVFAQRLQVVLEEASIPDSAHRMVEQACRERLLELAAAVPAAVVEARQAVPAAHGGKHGRHASTTAMDISNAVHAGVRAAVIHALEGVEEGVQQRRAAMLDLLNQRSAAAQQEFVGAFCGGVDDQVNDGGGTQHTARKEAAAWRWHCVERTKQWMALA